MKRHFKIATGYLNIDEVNLYFTSSGNWVETKKLKEKTTAVPVGHLSKKVFVVIVMGLVLLAAIIYLIAKVNSGGLALISLVTVPFFIYRAFKYFRVDLAQKFYIPLKKIKTWAFSGNNSVLTIRFLNMEDDEEVFVADEIESADVERIKELLNKF